MLFGSLECLKINLFRLIGVCMPQILIWKIGKITRVITSGKNCSNSNTYQRTVVSPSPLRIQSIFPFPNYRIRNSPVVESIPKIKSIIFKIKQASACQFFLLGRAHLIVFRISYVASPKFNFTFSIGFQKSVYLNTLID